MTLLALTQATTTYGATLDRQGKFDAAVALAEHNIFSARNISQITGLATTTVLRLAPKSEKTGGRFNPESLPHLVRLMHLRANGEVDVREAKAAVDKGTSTTFAARLTGIPTTTFTRYVKEARG